MSFNLASHYKIVRMVFVCVCVCVMVFVPSSWLPSSLLNNVSNLRWKVSRKWRKTHFKLSSKHFLFHEDFDTVWVEKYYPQTTFLPEENTDDKEKKNYIPSIYRNGSMFFRYTSRGWVLSFYGLLNWKNIICLQLIGPFINRNALLKYLHLLQSTHVVVSVSNGYDIPPIHIVVPT